MEKKTKTKLYSSFYILSTRSQLYVKIIYSIQYFSTTPINLKFQIIIIRIIILYLQIIIIMLWYIVEATVCKFREFEPLRISQSITKNVNHYDTLFVLIPNTIMVLKITSNLNKSCNLK